MRRHDARDGECGERGIDCALSVDVEMGCAFIHDQKARRAIQRACDHDALLLAPGKRGAHITHQRLIAHRHFDDVVMDASGLRGGDNAIHNDALIEEGDVFSYRALQQDIVLHHDAHLRTHSARAPGRKRAPIEQDLAITRRVKAGEEFEQRKMLMSV
jgi:hypothetical protein